MKTNTYGLKMAGLKKAAGETKGLGGYYSGHYVQIDYDRTNGDVLAKSHYSLGQNSWSEYHDNNVVSVGNISEPMTMQEIANHIIMAVKRAELFVSAAG